MFPDALTHGVPGGFDGWSSGERASRNSIQPARLGSGGARREDSGELGGPGSGFDNQCSGRPRNQDSRELDNWRFGVLPDALTHGVPSGFDGWSSGERASRNSIQSSSLGSGGTRGEDSGELGGLGSGRFDNQCSGRLRNQDSRELDSWRFGVLSGELTHGVPSGVDGWSSGERASRNSIQSASWIPGRSSVPNGPGHS